MITVTSKFNAATEEALLRCEQRVGRSIPSAYRSFLLVNNGGRCTPSCFEYVGRDGTGDSSVNDFLGVDSGHESIDKYLETYRGRIPSDVFPIADDPGGNLVLLGAEGANAGKVFFWHHELEADDGEPPTYDNVFLIADTFEAFLASLHE